MEKMARLALSDGLVTTLISTHDLNPAMIRAHRLLQTQTRLHIPYEMSRDFSHPLSFHVILSASVAAPPTNARDAMA